MIKLLYFQFILSIKNTLYILTTIILFSSCFSSSDDDYTYSSFPNPEYIPTYYENIGKIIDFKNDKGDKESLIVTNYNLETKLINQTPPYFYYDYMNIVLKDLNGSNSLRIEIKTDAHDNFSIKVANESIYAPFKDFQSIKINDTTYDKVKFFEFSSNFFDKNGSGVTFFYYDLEKGLIGFDESASLNKYRLIVN